MATSPPQQRSGRVVVLIATGSILCTFLFHFAFDRLLVQRAEAESDAVESAAVTSMVQLGRISDDLREARILLDEHIFESDRSELSLIEERLARSRRELHQAMELYEPLALLPKEAEEWRAAKTAIGSFEGDLQAVLALSRDNRDDEARTRMATARADFGTLDASLDRLLALNHEGILESMAGAARIRRLAGTILVVESVLQVVALLLLARWMLSRVGRYERHVESSNRELDAFAGRVAHDLKNALGPLLVSSSMLRNAANEPAQVREIAERTQRSSKRALSIIESLLAFARGLSPAHEGKVARVAEAVSAAVDELAPLAADLEIQVSVDVPPELRVQCDPGLLHVVMSNLVGNAVKYLSGCPERRVTVTARAEGSTCLVAVEDSGPGIAPEQQARIFEPFYRVAGSTVQGLGIGLATVQRIVGACQGRVSVRSTLGKGARFEVELRLAG